MVIRSTDAGTTSRYARYAGHPAANYERHFVTDIGEPFAQRVVAAAGLGQGDRVLDVACGTGVAARLAAEATGTPGSIAGIDVNPAMLDVARVTGGHEIDWRQGRAEDLPFDDETFDAVVSSLGFQFFPDKPTALREIRRVLTQGGRISVGTTGPTPPPLQVMAEVLGRHLGSEAARFIQTVFSVHDHADMCRMLDEAGFTHVEVVSGQIPLRVAPPADFVWQYVNSTPLASLAANLDEEARVSLEQTFVRRCEPFTDRGSLVMAPPVLVATGRSY